ncbi:MAG: hypothetical protein IPP63_08855 [Chloracidobacterium sp.]|nr:hypothetical protein [Chloracidobacterium sp.]
MKANLSSKYNVTGIGIFPIIFVAISLAAIAASFVLANSVQDYGIKSRGFSAIIVVYLSVCFAVHFLSFRSLADRSIASFDQSAEDRIDEQLKGIEEAGEYFRGSLKSGDVFRLVSSRAINFCRLPAVLCSWWTKRSEALSRSTLRAKMPKS